MLLCNLIDYSLPNLCAAAIEKTQTSGTFLDFQATFSKMKQVKLELHKPTKDTF